MNSPFVAGIVGTTGATIFCFFLARYLRALSHQMPLAGFLLVCVIGLAICFAIAWSMDRRARDRKARERSDQT